MWRPTGFPSAVSHPDPSHPLTPALPPFARGVGLQVAPMERKSRGPRAAAVARSVESDAPSKRTGGRPVGWGTSPLRVGAGAMEPRSRTGESLQKWMILDLIVLVVVGSH